MTGLFWELHRTFAFSQRRERTLTASFDADLDIAKERLARDIRTANMLISAAAGDQPSPTVFSIRARARQEAELIVTEAKATADRIRAVAAASAVALHVEADNYVDEKLANFEVVLSKTLAAVERGRSKLAGNEGDLNQLAQALGALAGERADAAELESALRESQTEATT